jgi:hypothetical protein
MQIVEFESDDLIYNRFDVIYGSGVKKFEVDFENKRYCLAAYVEEAIAKINIWGKDIPEVVLEQVMDAIFKDESVYGVEITRTVHNYKDFLYKTNDFRVPLPDSAEQLLGRVERRDRATIKRKKRWLDERVGHLSLEKYHGEIPAFLVEKYFEWKKTSHGTDYKLSPEKYLEKYYVTDALYLKAGNEDIAIAFYCGCEQNAFFENFSYNENYKTYSPGLLMYEILLEHLIDNGYQFLYMGGGKYTYKKRFGSEETDCYCGIVYNQAFMECFSKVLGQNNISGEVAIYGFGKFGHRYVPMLGKADLKVKYAIDRDAESEEDIMVKRPDEDVSDVNCVIVTMERKDPSIGEAIKKRGARVFYITDLLSETKEYYYARGKDD